MGSHLQQQPMMPFQLSKPIVKTTAYVINQKPWKKNKNHLKNIHFCFNKVGNHCFVKWKTKSYNKTNNKTKNNRRQKKYKMGKARKIKNITTQKLGGNHQR